MFGYFSDKLCFGRFIGLEVIDADYGLNSAFLHRFDMGYEIFASFFEKFEVFGRIFLAQRYSGFDHRASAVHFQSADGCDDDYGVGF